MLEDQQTARMTSVVARPCNVTRRVVLEDPQTTRVTRVVHRPLQRSLRSEARAEAQHVKAGDAASGTESRDVRRYGRGLA